MCNTYMVSQTSCGSAKVDKIQITSERSLKPSWFQEGALPVVILA